MSLRASESAQDKARILAVDTALGACSVAVLEGDKVLAHRFAEMARGHAEALAPMVQSAMAEIGFETLGRLAVTVGPGTFTGQRVGLAFMRGLRIVLQKPLIGVTTLEAMAAASLAPSVTTHGEADLCQGSTKAAAIHDAKREEAYLALWEDHRTVLEPVVMPFAEAVETIRRFGPCTLAGTGAPPAAAMLDGGFMLSPIRQPDALWVARLAQSREPKNAPPNPLYLRAPDAKLPAPA